MLTVESLSKRFASERTVDAVIDLNLKLERGRFLAIVGRSGSGKSTLLGMLGGISKPSSGSVTIDGVNQWSLGDDAHADFRNRKIGFVFQFASLLPTLRAIDNVALPALVGGALDEREAYSRARILLERVGLAERIDFYPGQLSGGEQRRVAIARALINSPEIVLADEPTADLDEETEEEILNLLVDIHRAFNLTLVVVTHNPAIAERADRIIDMRVGRATNREVRQTPAAQADRQPLSQPPDDSFADAASVEPVRRMFENSGQAHEKIRLGEGIERLIGRLVLLIIPMVLLAWGTNVLITNYERTAIDAKEEQRQILEDLATKDLRADIKDVTMGVGRSYEVSIYLRNTSDKDIYVTAPALRGFVQTGSSWLEVPMKPISESAQKVVKIDGTKIFRYSLEPDVHDFAQLLPYYMHVRLSNDMLVSPSNQPKNDLIERNDNYYVYLKPHDVDEAAILRKLKFPGKPPVWIPMPPH